MTLKDQIPSGQVMLLYWVHLPGDARHTASSTGKVIIPARGAIKRAEEIDRFGDRGLTDTHDRGYVVGGHGITIMWRSGRRREVRAQ